MAQFFNFHFPSFPCKESRRFLAFIWVIGLVLGVLVAIFVGEDIHSSMGQVSFNQISIVSLLISTFLPFLLSAFAVYISKPSVIYIVCFLKACSFSFVSLVFSAVFGSSGWLVRGIVMYCDIFSLPILYRFWIRHITGVIELDLADAGLLISVLMVWFFDMIFISPLFVEVF